MPVDPPRDLCRSGRRKTTSQSLFPRQVWDTRSPDILWRVSSALRQVCRFSMSMAPCRERCSRRWPCTAWCHKDPRGCETRALYCVRFESLSRPSSLAAVTRRIPAKDLKQKDSKLRATPSSKVLTCYNTSNFDDSQSQNQD